ncbi:MAG: hypothetical protein RLZZ196_3264 [Bacteroidota bacterium]
MKCRHCESPLSNKFLDLGYAPPSNAYLTKNDLCKPEVHLPLRVMVCVNCWLVQTEDYATGEDVFKDDYAYFSSTSISWLNHAKNYVDMISNRLSLTKNSMVIEIASNDGYLLQYFKHKDIPCLGIEPTRGTAEAARKKGIDVLQQFFSSSVGDELKFENRTADLIIGNNVYAHVPKINDFTNGLKKALKEGGTITLEFPHLLKLMQSTQFDTIYHEHFSYLSLSVVERIFNSSNLKIYDVEEIETHGGSLRVYGCHIQDEKKQTNNVKELLKIEAEYGLSSLSTYDAFQAKTDIVKNNFLEFLINAKKKGKKVVGYGAAAKGTTLLNYAGVKTDLIDCIYDAADSKIGKFLPGCHIPIFSHKLLESSNADYVIILPWNISVEIISKYSSVLKRDAKFITAIPKLYTHKN